MATKSVSEEIASYLPLLSEEQRLAILHLVLVFAKTNPNLSPEEESQIARRLNDFKTGFEKSKK